MARQRIVVYYDDGTKAEFNPNRPRLLLDMEKKFGVQTPDTHAQVFWLAHHALGGDTPFEEWVDTVDDLEDIDDAETAGKDPSSPG